jgi:hypothetical protein
MQYYANIRAIRSLSAETSHREKMAFPGMAPHENGFRPTGQRSRKALPNLALETRTNMKRF